MWCACAHCTQGWLMKRKRVPTLVGTWNKRWFVLDYSRGHFG